MKNTLLKERFKEVVEQLPGMQKEIAERIGVPPSTMSSVLGGKVTPSSETIIKLVSFYPHINLEYIMLGTGEPFKEEEDEEQIEMEANAMENLDIKYKSITALIYEYEEADNAAKHTIFRQLVADYEKLKDTNAQLQNYLMRLQTRQQPGKNTRG